MTRKQPMSQAEFWGHVLSTGKKEPHPLIHPELLEPKAVPDVTTRSFDRLIVVHSETSEEIRSLRDAVRYCRDDGAGTGRTQLGYAISETGRTIQPPELIDPRRDSHTFVSKKNDFINIDYAELERRTQAATEEPTGKKESYIVVEDSADLHEMCFGPEPVVNHRYKKSKGHLCFAFDGAVEYYAIGSQVYRAYTTETFDPDGHRYSKWYCTLDYFHLHRRDIAPPSV